MHPIDRHFRHRAGEASATPPEFIRVNVLAAARAGRRRALWWRMVRIGALLLLLGGGAALYMHQSQGTTPSARASADSASTSYPGPLTSASPEDQGLGVGSSDSEADARIAPRTLRPFAARPKTRSSISAEDTHLQPGLAIGAMPPSESPDLGTQEPGSTLDSESSVSARETLPLMSALQPERMMLSDHLRHSSAPDYYIPRGTWWIGAALSPQVVRYRWAGSDERLVDALGSANGSVGAWAIGMLGGRQWPSGLRLGVGAEVGRSEQAFRYVERESELMTETITNVVTLNTLVIFTTTDTLTRTIAHESDLRALDQRTVLSIPIELAWTRPFGRWRIGPRIGVVGTKTWVRSASSLVHEAGDARLTSAQLGGLELSARYPLAVSGIAGIDLGFALKERWSITASPFMSRGFGVFGESSSAYASPERFGMRLLFSHEL